MNMHKGLEGQGSRTQKNNCVHRRKNALLIQIGVEIAGDNVDSMNQLALKRDNDLQFLMSLSKIHSFRQSMLIISTPICIRSAFFLQHTERL